VTVTFYLRKRIGMTSFRKIHYLSLPAYLGATLHGLYAGTDSALPIASLLYKGTFLITLFLAVYWAFMLLARRGEEKRSKEESLRKKIRQSSASYSRQAGRLR
jgi:DMSO/TMAO reductase YedYZ heme-binding membrane subunit